MLAERMAMRRAGSVRSVRGLLVRVKDHAGTAAVTEAGRPLDSDVGGHQVVFGSSKLISLVGVWFQDSANLRLGGNR